MSLLNLTQENFDTVMMNNALVIVDFSASWCAPCRSFEKVIHHLDKQYPEVIFGSVDIEKEKELAADFNIVSVPSVMILRDQVVVFAQTGAITWDTMVELIEQAKQLDQKKLKKIQE